MKLWLPLIVLSALAGGVLLLAQPAQSDPHTALELAQMMPETTIDPITRMKTCTVTVDDNPDGGTDAVQCSSGLAPAYTEIYCENRSTTAVYHGNSTDDLDSVGPCVSTDSAACPAGASFRYKAARGILGADTASGSATLYCTEGR